MKTKKELIDAIATATELSRKDTESVIDALGPLVQAALAKGDEVVLPGIGKLSAKARAAKNGRNPKTGEAITIAARTVPAFSAAKVLKDAVASE